MSDSTVKPVAAWRSFGGWVKRFRHRSDVLDCDMTFGVYLPPAAAQASVPALWWLSGLTCTDENFLQKAGAQRLAARLGLALVCPDTSPRGTNLPGEHEDWDFGSGAGFYVNASQAPWSGHYRMYDYVTRELPEVAESILPLDGRKSVSGHSMGGHGALVCALREPERWTSVSAFSPICHPSDCPWGVKAFTNYLGEDRNDWAEWDATALVAGLDPERQLPLLVDQGTEDEFLGDQLKPGMLEQACISAHHPLELNFREGYDHSYYFVATFINDHLRHHAEALDLIA